jgi:hypothetical protein
VLVELYVNVALTSDPNCQKQAHYHASRSLTPRIFPSGYRGLRVPRTASPCGEKGSNFNRMIRPTLFLILQAQGWFSSLQAGGKASSECEMRLVSLVPQSTLLRSSRTSEVVGIGYCRSLGLLGDVRCACEYDRPVVGKLPPPGCP